jgi:gamma-glutamyltranspeptidase/glutathione hydrolase/leukotriene-C4 hydrolase
MFADSSPLLGGLATAIPGEIYGYWEAHKLGGRLPWRSLFQPTIQMCRHGFRVSRILAKVLMKSESLIRANPALTDTFINKATNMTYQEHELIRMPNLANTLDLISVHNVKAFYNSKLTRQMVDEINKNGGNVTVDDFKMYRPVVTKAMKIDLDSEYQLYTSPVPSSGVLVGFIMKIMNNYDLGPMKQDEEFDKTLYYHRLIETFKHAYAHRSKLGDETNDKEIQSLLEKIQDEKYLESIRARISDYHTYPHSYYSDKAFKEDKGTAHISILSNSDAVSLTSSINT